MKDDILKFNKGRTIVLRNLVQRLKSGAEHGPSRGFWPILAIFDDFPTIMDDVPDIVHCASGSCRIEKRSSPVEW